MTIAGQYGFKPGPAEAVPGTEAVGVVEALGEGVTHLKIGQRVAGGARQRPGLEYCVAAAAARLVPVPDSVSDETACQLVSMPLSTKMLLDTLEVREGNWIADQCRTMAPWANCLPSMARGKGRQGALVWVSATCTRL